MISFWDNLPNPFFALAPLEDITDAAFRQLVVEYGKPDVLWSEFTAADGLLLADAAGKEKLMRKLWYRENERPIVAQLFTSVPEHMEQVAKMVAEMGFDGFDINMGCPDRAIEKQGCGAAMIRDHDAARAIIRAALEGISSASRQIPVSVKTRLGYNSDELEEWLPVLLEENVAAVTLHARTRKEMSKVPARWGRIADAVTLRDKLGSRAKIIGNGDVESVAHGKQLAEQTDCDGVMVGRAAIGNPWIFARRGEAPTCDERIQAAVRHLELFMEIFGESGHYPPMKKHLSKYITDFDGAKELRMTLMDTKSTAAAFEVLSAHT